MKRFVTRLGALGLLVFATRAASPADAQLATVRPRDDAARAPSLAPFRAELLRAVERRDTSFVLGVLSEDVNPGHGSDRGVEGFRREWLLEKRPADETLFRVLEDVLRGGGVLQGDSTFEAPYASAAFPQGLDVFEHGVITGAGVRVRARPGLRGDVLAHLSYSVVPVSRWHDLPEADRRSWVPVELADGRRGYVASDYVRSPVGYRAIFVRRGGEWRLRLLLAGD